MLHNVVSPDSSERAVVAAQAHAPVPVVHVLLAPCLTRRNVRTVVALEVAGVVLELDVGAQLGLSCVGVGAEVALPLAAVGGLVALLHVAPQLPLRVPEFVADKAVEGEVSYYKGLQL